LEEGGVQGVVPVKAGIWDSAHARALRHVLYARVVGDRVVWELTIEWGVGNTVMEWRMREVLSTAGRMREVLSTAGVVF